MVNIPIDANELRQKNSHIDLSGAKRFSSSSFWHYTRASTANLILKNSTFRMRNIAEMNDRHEAAVYGEKSKFIHALCFCNSNTEKIPMWYLYAGLTGKGVSIGLTPSVMIKFVSSIQTAKTSDGEVLLREKDFELEYGWVFYRQNGDNYAISYRRMWYSIRDNPEAFEKDNYFIKDYPWEYEKEFRILIKNKTGKEYAYLDIDFPADLFQKIKIRFAPEIEEDEIKKTISISEGFQKYSCGKFLRSDLKISMDLFNRNKDEMIENFTSLIDSESVHKVCEGIQMNKLCKKIK